MATEFNSSALKTTYATELKAYYRFESGALTTDTSGNTHTLTAIGTPAEGTGKFGGDVVLADGTDAYSIVNHADFRPTTAFTVSAWIKVASAPASGREIIFSNWYTAVYGYYLGVDQTTGYPRFTIGSQNGGANYHEIVGGTNVCDGTWHFVTATWDGSNSRIYVDGASNATAVAGANPTYHASNSVRVGCRCDDGSTNSLFLNGEIDDLFLLNGTALTLEEIQSLYVTAATTSSSGFFNFM